MLKGKKNTGRSEEQKVYLAIMAFGAFLETMNRAGMREDSRAALQTCAERINDMKE